ncbi:fatty acid desaturase family protein [Leptothoe sp. PORK10 BA2]|uniref:fatty acid desaturase family protein n=1 Tax=Leptothoe sp. PORK10 BA2 TaxID=3110254 RepID=UPI002B2213D8|nr:acyl-CoA desaturase [Leptothoe sp. PORK10 BA2]MEA5464564.1 acyl-CoA desaturase [Leptothoe sp. PORK10 BA2]
MLNPGQKLYRDLRNSLAETDFFERSTTDYLRKVILYGALHILSYIGLYFCATTYWRWAALIGLTLSGIQFYYISHDAGHYAISDHKNTNLRLGHIGHTFIAGGSFRYWQYKHDLHHRYCNDETRDPDMNALFLKLYEADCAERPAWVGWVIRRQSYLLWVLAMFHNFDFQRLSWIYAIANPKRCQAERVLIPLHFSVYLILPIVLLGWQMALTNYIISTMLSGVILAKLFAINHMGMPSVPSDHDLSFIEQQVITSRNVLVPSLWDDYFGGLHYQIEHHLFPWVSVSRYRSASPIVKGFCQEHGIAYVEENFGLAMLNIGRHLEAMSKVG